ncbi:MAG: hypothetical protein ACRBBR_07975 [Cellvibrionaceae bacterium]
MTSIIRRGLSVLSQLFLYRIPISIDRNFRRFDYFLNNSYHPDRKKWRISGHGPSILLVMAYTVCASLYGPTWDAVMAYFPSLYDTEVADFTWKNGLMFGFLAILLFVVVIFPRFQHRGEYVRSLHIIILSLITLFIIAFADKGATEADNTIYYHGFFVFGLILLLFAWLAKPFALLLLKKFVRENSGQIQKALANTELFKSPKAPQFLHSKIFFAGISAITHYPLHLLLLPSLLILFLKDVGSNASYWLIGSALALSFMLSFWGSMHSRWNNMFQLITRISMRGGMLVVSVAIIFLAIARLLDIGYVTTVMDGTPLTVIPYFAAFYFYFLAYEYWANRSFNEILLPIFGPRNDYGRIKFDIDPSAKGKNIRIEHHDRYLQFHGIDRFLVTGKIENNSKKQYGYEAYNRETLFRRLLESDIGQGDDEEKRVKSRAILRRLCRLTHIYFSTLNILLVLAVMTFFALANYNEHQQPVWKADFTQTNKATFSLSDALHQQANDKQPAILLAASGGGTRAALYTSSVLYGLNKLKQDQNIIMGSGVSGGGASLAYFAFDRHNLIDPSERKYEQDVDRCSNRYAHNHYTFSESKQDQSWKCYFEKISRPFIKDVIQGTAEWRIAGAVSNGTLLAESLARNFKAGASDHDKVNQNVTFGDLNNFGLMLNTALVAHPYEYSEELSDLYAKQSVSQDGFYTIHGGSRLVFTNLLETSAFPTTENIKKIDKEIDAEDIFLKYEIVQDAHMPLTVAAALNANFPPVFSNSLVVKKELLKQERAEKETAYYVTDGGAVENRGILSLLYSLRSGLTEFHEKYNGQCLPNIHIVVAEASAASIDYSNNRGLETALGGSLPIANQLYQELLKDAQQQYREINTGCEGSDSQEASELKLHYLSMPRFFRTRGGMGTHWMMPSNVKLTNPSQPDPLAAAKNSHRLSRSELEALLLSLYAAPEQCENIVSNGQNSDKVVICQWLEQSKSQKVWDGLKQHLIQ